MELGKIKPGHFEGEEVQMLGVPVSAFLMPKGTPLKVVSIYEDEGHLCIDVEEFEEKS